MKSLVVYFSMKGQTITPHMTVEELEKGHTAVVAEVIANAIDGDLFEIETLKTYKEDHFEMNDESMKELKGGERPELKEYPDYLDNYDIFFLGYPNWWGTLPMPVVGFLEHYSWDRKRIVPFNTSEGSGPGKSQAKIKEICQGASIDEVYALRGSEVGGKIDEIATWARGKVI